MKEWNDLSNEEKCEIYSNYYLDNFRKHYKECEEALTAAKKRLDIAEKEYAEGKIVTGNEDGIPTILKMLKNNLKGIKL